VADESNADLRWLTERIDRNHAETTADIARLEAQVTGIPASLERYVLQRVYDADERRRAAERDDDRGRIKRLEDNDTSKASGNRTWLLGLVQTVVGVALGVVAAYLTARGGK
jgi:hypothetical protein